MTNILLSAMVAVSENNVIGAEGGLPWRLSNDMKWFKKVTMGKPVIMGRRTFESLPKLLSGRANIIVTRAADFQAAGTIVTHSLEEALEAGRKAAATLGVQEMIVIGGAEIYRQSLNALDRIYLTRVHATVDGDTFFPDLGSATWKESAREHHKKSEKDMFDHSFIVLDRVNHNGN